MRRVARLKGFKKVKEQWLRNHGVRERCDELKAEFQIAEESLEARAKSKVSRVYAGDGADITVQDSCDMIVPDPVGGVENPGSP
jgi:hypothetical protein